MAVGTHGGRNGRVRYGSQLEAAWEAGADAKFFKPLHGTECGVVTHAGRNGSNAVTRVTAARGSCGW